MTDKDKLEDALSEKEDKEEISNINNYKDEDLDTENLKEDKKEETSQSSLDIFKKHKTAIISVIVLALLIGGIIYFFNSILKDPAIYKGIRIDNIDVGGKTKEEAIKLLKDKKEPEIDQSKMELKFGDKSYHIEIRDIGFEYDYEKAVNQAHSLGRKGKNIDRLKKIRSIKKNNENIGLDSKYNKEKAAQAIEPLKEDINIEKIEANYDFNGGNPIISEEAVGRMIDEEKLKDMIDKNIHELKPLEIPVKPVNPIRTKAALQRINGVIGQFKTSFPNSTPGRKENIKISSQAVTNRGVIMPGDTVSFNQLTGDRSKANGYKEAIVIEEGNYTDGVGGGVCQTSTTLYNALLRADLTIVSRAPHSIPAKYVPYGQDAAVAYDYLDLKFRNDFDFPIYINSIFTGDSIMFQVYGDTNVKNYGVQLDSETVETVQSKVEKVVDKSLEPGKEEVVQHGRTGYKVNTYKSIIRNGQVQDRKLITQDYYRPKNTVYRVGPSE